MQERKADKPVTPAAALMLLRDPDKASLAGGIIGVSPGALTALLANNHLLLLLERMCTEWWPEEGQLQKKLCNRDRHATSAAASITELVCALAERSGSLAERVIAAVPELMRAAPGAFPSRRHGEAFGLLLYVVDHTDAADQAGAARVQWEVEWAKHSAAAKTAAAATGRSRRSSGRNTTTPAVPPKKRPLASVSPKRQATAKRLNVCTAAAAAAAAPTAATDRKYPKRRKH